MADNVTIIGAETLISGEIRGDQNVLVRGRVDGRVSITSTLTVEDGARFSGNIEMDVELPAGITAGKA